jgi:hypothetical protein
MGGKSAVIAVIQLRLHGRLDGHAVGEGLRHRGALAVLQEARR